jgi:hypothetical protein
VDKEAREEFCDIVHDILNPYVSNFLPKQLAVLQSRLAGILTLHVLLAKSTKTDAGGARC